MSLRSVSAGSETSQFTYELLATSLEQASKDFVAASVLSQSISGIADVISIVVAIGITARDFSRSPDTHSHARIVCVTSTACFFDSTIP
ncbi:hypothetical protein PC116_g7478 [Phytophthora cactorum]|nr:hypothetical protein PC116_g7478 [Phytophthora cactorum]